MLDSDTILVGCTSGAGPRLRGNSIVLRLGSIARTVTCTVSSSETKFGGTTRESPVDCGTPSANGIGLSTHAVSISGADFDGATRTPPFHHRASPRTVHFRCTTFGGSIFGGGGVYL